MSDKVNDQRGREGRRQAGSGGGKERRVRVSERMGERERWG